MINKDDFITRLLALDTDAALLFEPTADRFELYIIGGGALLLQNYISRSTLDIDTIGGNIAQLNSLMTRYDMNAQANAYIDLFPEDYRVRAIKLPLETKKIDYYVLSLEDLVISKIPTGREKDWEDITSQKILDTLNWQILDKLANEVREGINSNNTLSEFNYFYKKYYEENKKC